MLAVNDFMSLLRFLFYYGFSPDIQGLLWRKFQERVIEIHFSVQIAWTKLLISSVSRSQPIIFCRRIKKSSYVNNWRYPYFNAPFIPDYILTSFIKNGNTSQRLFSISLWIGLSTHHLTSSSNMNITFPYRTEHVWNF